jgi:uncharacterized glyoxalase superfamily protein PhnB
MSVNPIPAGFHSIAPNIIVKSVDAAVSFYKQAFGAEENPASIHARRKSGAL